MTAAAADLHRDKCHTPLRRFLCSFFRMASSTPPIPVSKGHTQFYMTLGHLHQLNCATKNETCREVALESRIMFRRTLQQRTKSPGRQWKILHADSATRVASSHPTYAMLLNNASAVTRAFRCLLVIPGGPTHTYTLMYPRRMAQII